MDMFLFINLNQRNESEFIMDKFRPKMPPFGIAYISAVLKDMGIKSILHDDNLHEFSNEQLHELFKKYRGQVETVGLTSVSTTFKQLQRVAKIARFELPDVKLIAGGPHARLLPEEIISIPEIDLVFTSEAELAIKDFASGKKYSEIEGIMYKDGNSVKGNPHINYIKNLDEVPFPDYDLFDIKNYHSTRGIAKRYPNSYIITSRGCPYKCTFCSSLSLNPSNEKIVRFRSPENVLEEIEILVKKYGVKELFFSDDMFTGKKSHLMGICEGLIRKKLNVIWVCMTHVNNIDHEKLKIMKKAGCHQVCYGVESGDPEIQKVIQKNIDLSKVQNVVKMTQKQGIDVRCSFMFGNQNENPVTLQKTIDFARSLKIDFASFNIATPYPGTILRKWALENDYVALKDYEDLDSTKYVLVTPDLPAGTVEKYCNDAFRSFYYRLGYVLRRLRHIRDIEDLVRYLKSAYYAFKSLPLIFKTLLKRKLTRKVPE